MKTQKEKLKEAHAFLESIHVPCDATWNHIDLDKMLVTYADQFKPIKLGDGRVKIGETIYVNENSNRVIKKFPTDKEIKVEAIKYSDGMYAIPNLSDKEIQEFAQKDFIYAINWLKSKLQ